jgi:uncharacterized membrane protein YfcA
MSALDWTVLATAAVLVGFAKTAIGGVGAIATALFATVLPAKQSTGALLPLLLAGDVVAVTCYRRHADWPLLLRLFPSVAAGVVVGAVFVAKVDDTAMRRTIGALLVLLVVLTLAQRRMKRTAFTVGGRPATLLFGLLAGFTTMVANAGGPVMSLYLLAAGASMMSFLGTGAWFFFVVNLFKLPFSFALGLIDVSSLGLDAMLLPALLAGAVIGRLVISRLDQSIFEALILAFTAASAINLLR